jgi:hypothetical protein
VKKFLNCWVTSLCLDIFKVCKPAVLLTSCCMHSPYHL